MTIHTGIKMGVKMKKVTKEQFLERWKQENIKKREMAEHLEREWLSNYNILVAPLIRQARKSFETQFLQENYPDYYEERRLDDADRAKDMNSI